MKPYLILTGTHLTPAVALNNKLKGSGYKLAYIGKKSSKITIPIISLKAPKLHRHNLFSSVSLPFKFPVSFFKALFILASQKPNLVISFGGFIALPVCLASRLLKIPIVIHDQTFAAGLVNKLTAKLATKIAISWPESFSYFPRNKTFLTGNPIRSEILNIKKTSKKSQKSKILYITGGNQGSRIINQTINQILPQLLLKYQVIHQFGLNQKKSAWQSQLKIKNSLPKNLQKQYRLEKWFNAHQQAVNLTKADLVISRSGANTITELGFLSKPAILIPLPFSQKNELLINAQFLTSLGLALILPQSKLSSKNLLVLIKKAFQSLPKKSSKSFPFALVKTSSSKLHILLIEVLGEKD